MALNIKNRVAETLARELAETTGESLTDAVIAALRQRLASIRQAETHSDVQGLVSQIQNFVRELPNASEGDPHEVLPYDEYGLPG